MDTKWLGYIMVQFEFQCKSIIVLLIHINLGGNLGRTLCNVIVLYPSHFEQGYAVSYISHVKQ